MTEKQGTQVKNAFISAVSRVNQQAGEAAVGVYKRGGSDEQANDAFLAKQADHPLVGKIAIAIEENKNPAL